MSSRKITRPVIIKFSFYKHRDEVLNHIEGKGKPSERLKTPQQQMEMKEMR